MNEKDVIIEIMIKATALGDESVDRIHKRAQKAAAYMKAAGLIEVYPAVTSEQRRAEEEEVL